MLERGLIPRRSCNNRVWYVPFSFFNTTSRAFKRSYPLANLFTRHMGGNGKPWRKMFHHCMLMFVLLGYSGRAKLWWLNLGPSLRLSCILKECWFWKRPPSFVLFLDIHPCYRHLLTEAAKSVKRPPDAKAPPPKRHKPELTAEGKQKAKPKSKPAAAKAKGKTK